MLMAKLKPNPGKTGIRNKLIAIYEPENPNESILLAEMYRQLG
jgi:hypothetical protein